MRESIKEIKLGKIKLYKSIKSEYYTIRYILGIRYYKKINLNKYFNDFQNKVSNNFFKKSLQLLTDAIIDPYGASMMKLMLNSLNVKPEYERFFYEMSDDDICIDGGANIGHFTDVILHKKATVYSFEPNPVLYKNLQQKYKNRSNVFLFDSAISTHNGEAQFSLPKCRNENYVTYSEWGSIKDVKLDSSRKEIYESVYTVKTIDFTDFLKNIIEKHNKNIYLVKLDIEGAEFEVLNKIIEEDLYKNINYIVVETHERFFPNGGDLLEKLKRKIIEKNITNIYLDWI